jgi:toxin co-regulated pilus biosynthesis protein E
MNTVLPTRDPAALNRRLAAINRAIERWTARLGFGTSARLRFYERLSGYLQDGIPLDSAVSMIHRRWVAKRKSGRFVTEAILTALRDGRRLSDALRAGRWAPTQEIVLIEAGERAGDLAQGLGQAIFVTTALGQLRSSIVKGLAYPVFLLAALVGLFVFFGLKTVPEMVKVIPLDRWPEDCRSFHALTTGLVEYGPYGGAGLAGLLALAVWSLPRWTGRWRDRFDRAPPWSLYRTLHGSAVLIALGGLLTTGTPFAEALRVVKASASRWLAVHLDTIHLRIRTGMAAGEAMDMHLFRFAEVGDDLADYGRLSNFERAVVLLGRRTIERVLSQVAAATALANTGLILVIAGSVLWMYVNFMAISDAATSTFK